ncbi:MULTISPECIES: efflux RND transporter periplasmic adaptor subunit [unclassified Sinorhizobium]|uniref:efflux RND transporter periplasmic adaptor subunit n=1 Tax=unclassified Sinorhizobium TaxID=2613772 RepID=UPI0024C3ACCB|nr:MULTISPECIES: efflux RND transporter periplasmic adaptor subunit [unclassified Sinorhizobium]MDK1374735.1 efflux RND transporter periplasmic adaptor subunit [Sinorhizobium sp. 6-70]MDK1479081.1 efflux RND transporter periplasmic adaptor subunit [Sinorhizobium sp. 6-117]
MGRWVLLGAFVSIGSLSAAAVVPNAGVSEWITEQQSAVQARLAQVSPEWVADELSAVHSKLAAAAASVTRVSDASRTQEEVYRFATVERGDLVSTVTATGQLTPVATVVVSTQISGQIDQIQADFNAPVRRGDVIATLDATTFRIAVEQARAEVDMAAAALLKAEVAAQESAAELKRRDSLHRSGAGSLVERDKAETAKRLADAQLLEARSGVQRTNAALKQARTNLERTRIHSPVDGVVVDRSIEVGQIVAASLQAPTLFTIAKDLRDMQVNMLIDESAIGRISPGLRVEFTVDAYPGRNFGGSVEQVRLSPTTSQNVVTYTVVVKAPNPELMLLPGMTATARVIVTERNEVLKTPTAAIRFRQSGPRLVPDAAVLWLERAGELKPVDVKLGVTDGDMVEIIGAEVAPGDLVAVGVRPVARKESAAKRLIGVFQ